MQKSVQKLLEESKRLRENARRLIEEATAIELEMKRSEDAELKRLIKTPWLTSAERGSPSHGSASEDDR
jgi:regulator of replication initiation timing